jgi:hypothetical protein
VNGGYNKYEKSAVRYHSTAYLHAVKPQIYENRIHFLQYIFSCPEDGGNTFLQNVGTYLQVHERYNPKDRHLKSGGKLFLLNSYLHSVMPCLGI